ncbi:MAG: Hpt domain-containing protein, partial [Nitrosomonas sp.]|nr:Hpt domain-containing protein [Nitrosomonas sp.]
AGLLKWLRNPTDQDSLQQMINAVSLVEKIPGSTEQRSFWWVCTGFLESLKGQNTTIDLPLRRLCGKIEQEIRRLAENKTASTIKLLQEILYHLAQSESDSNRIRDIKRIYKLHVQPTSVDEQTNIQQIADEKRCDSALRAMHASLKEINENWRKFCAGDRESQPSLLRNIEKLRVSAAQIKFPPLEKLIGVTAGSITYLRIRPQDMNEDVALEIATALLLIDNAITNFQKLPAKFSGQVEALSTRLRMITTGKRHEKGLPNIPGPDETEYKTHEKTSKLQVIQEILVNLSQIEEILDNFFIDPSMRKDLPKLSLLFKQTAGALVILNLSRANTLLYHCQKLVDKFLQPDYKISHPEQVQLADGLSSLGFYIEALTSAHPDNDKILETALSLFSNKLTPETNLPILAETATPTLVNVLKEEEIVKKIEPELLHTFLAESDEVLQDIEKSLITCQNNPNHNPSLVTLRRGFHTLKGSGRMVDLHELSDVAWNIEQILNRWLSEKKPATQSLINLLTQAHHEFSQWCDDLKKHGTTDINADQLLLLAGNLSNNHIPETIREDKVAVSATDQENETLPSVDTGSNADVNITIGDFIVARDLFDVFTTEARQHFASLENGLNGFFEDHNKPLNHQFMLAAHTLSSISRALGLSFIADPSSALEQWSSQLLKYSGVPEETDLQHIQKIIVCLGKMLESIYNQQLPQKTDIQAANLLSQELDLLINQEKQRTKEKSSEIKSVEMTETFTLNKSLSDQQSFISSQSQLEPDETIDTLDPILSQIFFDEARELIPEVGGKLRAWQAFPQDDNIHRALLRTLHTLKGSARMAGAIQLGEMIHNMESGVENTSCANNVSIGMIENLEIEFDSISEHIERLQHAIETKKQIANLNQIETENLNNSSVSSSAQPTKDTSKLQNTPEKIEFATHKTVLRVNEELIDHLLNESGEISIIRSKVEAQLNNFKQSLLDLTESAERLRGQLREVEIQAESQMQSRFAQPQKDDQTFDPLEFDRFTRFQELTRLMAESVDDVVTVQQSLRTTHNAAEEAVNQQALISRKLQQALMRIRTVPFGNFSEHFYRIVRQTARDLSKKASLNIQGDEVEIDRSVLEKINSPIDHLLRNAVAHGIEEPNTRLSRGKPEFGQITIHLHQKGNEVIISISDDGNGLDLSRIREEAIRLKLIKMDDQLTNDQLISLIFSHGLTTLTEATGTAGRGIGLDVVKNEVTSLGGRIDIHSEFAKGTAFHIHLPLTLAVAQTLLVRAGENTYAVPTAIVKHVKELSADALNTAYQNQHARFNDKNYPFTYLLHLFGETDRTPEVNRHNRILFLESETYQIAVHVDELIGNSEVVVKNIGPQMAHAPGVEGATVMGDGEIILIINPNKLMKRDEVKKLFTTPPLTHLTKIDSNVTLIPTIMIVDDSLTVRKVTSRLLERKGCHVLVAKDGVGAINLLRETVPDVMLVDLEMPHMNGFELIRNVRNNPDMKNLPIIIISSRFADKHRKMAEELNVNVFLGKPYNEEELLDHITQYIKKTSAAV